MTDSVDSILIDLFKQNFSIDSVDPSWNFFELGINSVELSQICIELSKKLNQEIDILMFYEFPTIASIAKAISNLHDKK